MFGPTDARSFRCRRAYSALRRGRLPFSDELERYERKTARRTEDQRNAPTALEPSAKEVLLAEYEALKSEQTSRIVLRDRLMYAALAALAAALALVVQPVGRPYLLLLLPLVCVVLGWTYFANDQKISSISRYLRGHLAPSLGEPCGRADGAFNWEAVHRCDPLRRLDKLAQLAVDLLMFVVPALMSVILYWNADGVRAALLVVSVIEVLVILSFAARVVAAADLSAGASRPHDDPRVLPRSEPVTAWPPRWPTWPSPISARFPSGRRQAKK